MQVLNIERLKELAKKHDKTPSGKTKNSILRARKIIIILSRDGYKCTECPNKENLTIDHTNGRAFAKHDNYQKYDPKRCQTLCVVCHKKKNLKTNKNDNKIF
jgi:5-methylcytosine-specific restriction endonuclease McrA